MRTCQLCGDEVSKGDWPVTTNNLIFGAEAVCLSCNGRGHTASLCPSPDLCPRCRERRSRAMPCSICHGFGHVAKQCPSPLCRRCGSKGHYEDDCFVAGPSPQMFEVILDNRGDDLGLVLERHTSTQPLKVVQVTRDGPADVAGIEVGMILESIQGHAIRSEQDLHHIIYEVHRVRATRVLIEGWAPINKEYGASYTPTRDRQPVEPPAALGKDKKQFRTAPRIPSKPQTNPLDEVPRRSKHFR